MRDTLTDSTILVSCPDGQTTEGNKISENSSISSDGRFVVFTSDATNLIASPAITNTNVFLRDTHENTTTIISVSTGGAESNDKCNGGTAVSQDANLVAFTSMATNLVGSPAISTTNISNVFIRNRGTGITSLVSVASGGSEAGNASSSNPQIAGNGKFILFLSSATNLVSPSTNYSNIFLRNLDNNTTELISARDGAYNEGNGISMGGSSSSDGRLVVFFSASTDLVPGVNTGGLWQVYIRDRSTKKTSLVSLAADGKAANGHSAYCSISPDGSLVAFASVATNLVTSPAASGTCLQLYVRNIATGQTRLVSMATDGITEANGDCNSRFITNYGSAVFSSTAKNLTDPATVAPDIFIVKNTL